MCATKPSCLLFSARCRFCFVVTPVGQSVPHHGIRVAHGPAKYQTTVGALMSPLLCAFSFPWTKKLNMLSLKTIQKQWIQSAPLHYAAKLETPGLVKLLLHHRASASVVDANGRRPLHLACIHDRIHTVQALIHWHADDPTISLEKTLLLGDHQGDTALHLVRSLHCAENNGLCWRSKTSCAIVPLLHITSYTISMCQCFDVLSFTSHRTLFLCANALMPLGKQTPTP